MIKKNKCNYTYRVIKNGKTIDRCQTHSKRRFYHRIRTINWQKKPLKVYLRVSYGRGKTNRGTVETFYNSGTYTSKKDLLEALSAFIEQDLPKKLKGEL